MKLKIGTLFKLIFGISLCGGGVLLSANKNTKEAMPLNASSSSYWATVNSNANADTLFNKLHALINTNTVSLGYDGLWDAYQDTDQVPGTKKIWDMYGGYQFTYQSGGKSYGKEGDCYNREHSIPKSWWGKTEDERYCDIIHLLPTDGYVNNKRSNYAFGEVDSASYSFSFGEKTDGHGNVIQKEGVSKLGTAKSINGVSYPGGKSPVFEPDDQYKGDFARIYYYFATRYGPKNKIATQGDGARMFSNDSNNFYMTAYGKALMNKWHVQDPVSQKELDRNDGVEATQKNRNPYVDHPEWADKIFGSNYANVHGGGSGNDDPSLSVVASSTNLKVGESTTLTAYTQNLSGVVQWYIADYSEDVISLSSTTGSSITVNALLEGTKTVWAYVGTCSDSVNITVSSSGSTIVDDDDGTIQFGTNNVQINNSSVTDVDNLGNTWVINTQGTTSFNQNDKYSQIGSKNNPASSVSFSMNLGNAKKITDFSIALGGFNGTAGTVTLKADNYTIGSGSLNAINDVTVTATDKTKTASTLSATITGISKGVKAYSISYSTESSGSVVTKTLSSISLSTNSVKTVFNVGDTFTYSGLVVNANYSNNTTKVVTPTSVSTPNMSSAGTKVVTVSYTEEGVTKTDTYQITVNAGTSVPSYISACSTKTYFVGDAITKDDLHVEDNLGNVIKEFYFSDDNYQFIYDDAVSGGGQTDKIFNNSISYDGMMCSLTVVVQRKERTVSAAAVDTITSNDLEATGNKYVEFSDVKKVSNARYAGMSAKSTNGAIQLNNKSDKKFGIVSTTSGGTIHSVTINVESGTNTIEIYGSNAAYSSYSDLYNTSTSGTLVGSLTDTGTITFTSDYKFVGIRSKSGALYLSDITFSYKGGETAVSLSNFIMFEDTDNQCKTKLNNAEGYFGDLSSEERLKFMTSNDYVIYNARERFEAWARHENKTIVFENNDYAVKPALYSRGIAEEITQNDSTIFIMLIICGGASLTTALFFFKRKRLSK